MRTLRTFFYLLMLKDAEASGENKLLIRFLRYKVYISNMKKK